MMNRIKEDEFSIEKFGEDYQEYLTMVAAWNVPKGLRRTPIRGRGEL
jgi:hypothetical protein